MRAGLFALLWGCCCHRAAAQVQRTYTHLGIPVQVLVQSNRMENNFDFPGMNALIIIGAGGQQAADAYRRDKLRTMPVSGMNDYACFYYLSAAEAGQFSSFKTFLAGFVNWCYRTDNIDRNTTTVVCLGADSGRLSCASFAGLDTIAAGIHILGPTADTACAPFIAPSENYIWQSIRQSKTAIRYPVPGFAQMEQRAETEQQQRAMAGFAKKRGDVFFQATVGRHQIGQPYHTGFDTATLVDFTRFKTQWHFTAGYGISHRLWLQAELAFIYSGKKKQVDSIDWHGSGGITVTGSGYAGAIIRYGVGLGCIPYHHRRIDIITGCSLGRLSALAAGGGGTKTVGSGSSNTDIARDTRQTSYGSLLAGARYRLSNTFYAAANFQYTISAFAQPLGSVNAFTGWSLNAGFGFVIPTKNKDNHER